MANQKFPEVGLRAVFEITGFNRNYNKYQSTMRDIDRITKRTAQSVTQSGQNLARNLTDLLDLSPLFDGLVRGGNVSAQAIKFLEDAFSSLEKGVGINAVRFTELIASGETMGAAFEQAKEKTGELADTVEFMGRSFSTTAIAVTVLTAALAGTARLVQKSITEYTELAEATRRLSAETGLLSREASGWIEVAEASGVSAQTASRGLSQFLSRVSDLRREQQLGEESTTDFSKALDFLQVSITDGDDNLKSTETLLADINDAFQRLGPGARSAAAATDLFGRTGRQLLPILTDQETSLAEFTAMLERLGSGMTALDQQQYGEFLKSQIKLQAAMQGFFQNVARQWVPILGGLADVVSELIGIWNLFARELFGVEFAVQAVANTLHLLARTLGVLNRMLTRTIDLAKNVAGAVNPLLGMYSRLATNLQAVAQAEAEAAQAAAEQLEIERERRKAIEDTLDQLDELKSKLNDKLSDIDRDAERQWESILVGRVRQHFDRALQETRRMDDLRAALNAKLDAIDRDFARRWEDILVGRMRDAILRGIRLADQYEDLARNAAKSRQDAIRDFEERKVEQQIDLQRKIEDAQRDGQRKREQLERDHYRRLRDIQTDYLDTVTEAARRNDAVAVARAVRERNREVRDEQTRASDARQDLAISLAEKRADLERDRREREQDQRTELAKTLRRIEENYRDQRKELEEKNRKEAALRALQYKWELDDFNDAKKEQLDAAGEWWDDQLKAQQLANKRADEDRAIQYRRQLTDFNTNQRQKQADALFWYAQERYDLATHINLTTTQLEQAYTLWIGQAASAAAAVAQAIAGGLGGLGIIGGSRLIRPIPMAKGGIIQASSPTTVVMGDAGPETGIFLPGGSGSLSVNHNFGRMDVGFDGLPGGMNTQQIQSIVFDVMTKIAKGVPIRN